MREGKDEESRQSIARQGPSTSARLIIRVKWAAVTKKWGEVRASGEVAGGGNKWKGMFRPAPADLIFDTRRRFGMHAHSVCRG